MLTKLAQTEVKDIYLGLAGYLKDSPRESAIFAFSLFFTITHIFLALISFPYSIYFYNYDDAYMFLSSTGIVLTTKPEATLLYSSKVLGNLFNALYIRYPVISWYPLYQEIIVGVSYFAVCWAIFSRGINKFRLILTSLLFWGFTASNMYHLQFTISGIIGTGGAIVLLISACTEKSLKSGWRIFRYLFGLMLFLAASLLRWKAMLMALAAAFPLICFGLYMSHKNRQPQYFIYSISIILAVIFFPGIHNTHNNSEDWQNWSRFNVLKSEFTDYHRVDANDPSIWPLLKEANWSPNDIRMIKRWNHFDPLVFSSDKMSIVLKNADIDNQYLIQNMTRGFKILGGNLIVSRLKYQALFLLIFALLTSYSVRNRLFLEFNGLFFLGLFYLISTFFNRLPKNVTEPCFWIFAASTLFVWVPKQIFMNNILKTLTILATVVLFIFTGQEIGYSLKSNRDKSSLDMKTFLRSFNEKGKLILISGASNYYNGNVVTFEDKKHLKDLNIIESGPMNQSPTQKKMLEKYGIKSISIDLINKDNFYISVHLEIDRYLIKTFYKEHYGRQVFFDPVYKNPYLPIYKIKEI